MIEQDRFLEMLQDIKDIAASQQNMLLQEEVERYLSGMKLDKAKLDAVYHYLSAAGIKVEGYRSVPDIRIAELDNDNLYRIIKEFMSGDKNARDKLIESRLGHVMKLASSYKKREIIVNKNVSLDEVIAEGNVGLLEGIAVIEENRKNYYTKEGEPDYSAILGIIETSIVNAMESMLDYETNNKDWESAMLARTNLLHEAAKLITEEIGRVPTRMELSDYTKVSLEEIDNIRGLSKDAERVADDIQAK